ncbi:WD40-repeat-containing domain protein [Suillus subalutaceus]|uniref:WD40-repeat-containing domain protein n=1 Tax=Suillus subalutaceus TaxID=48586 RepID=UPI001B85D7A1|nr:WD40-repeat-containing domain protein [Suillus subalutaceus]KAG1853188.1 WD40-repeat-containing domain protein [Suillus subalutaceus]
MMLKPAPPNQKNLTTTPYQKIKIDTSIRRILPLPGGEQRMITYAWDGSFRVWDLERSMHVGEEWKDKYESVKAMALSPDGKTMASGSSDGTVRLWNINTGKVIKEWTGYMEKVRSVCWSSDGGRVVSGSSDGTFRVQDVESGTTMIGPIKAGEWMNAVCYSPDAMKIATSGDTLKIWDADTGELFKTFEVAFSYLEWNRKTLVAGGSGITKFDTATWSQTTVLAEDLGNTHTISLSSDERILASHNTYTIQLWNLETSLPIGTLLHHCEDSVTYATFSADGKFLITGCDDDHMYTWDVSAIIKEAGLLSDIVDATPRPVSTTKGARRIPQGFFDNARDGDLSSSRTQPYGRHDRPTPAPRQRIGSRLSSFWHRFKPHRANEPSNQSRSHPLSWTRVSGILRRRHGSDIQLQEPPIVEVPYTAGKPRNYHARKKKPAASSSRPPKTHITQQPSAVTQDGLSSQLPPPTVATTSTLSAVADTSGATGTGTMSHPRITSPLGLPTGFPDILLPYGRTAPHSFYSLQGYSILPHIGHVLPYSDYTLPPSFGLSSSMTSIKPQGSLLPSMPGCNIRASVPSAQARPYPSRMPSSPTTSFIGRLCTPIEEEEEEEELTPVEPQDGLFPGYDISASESTPSAQAGPYPSRTPSSPSTSFIRSLCTLIEEEEEELISVEPQGGLFSGCDVSASVPGAQAGSYRTPSSPSTSFIRRLCTLIEEGEEE